MTPAELDALAVLQADTRLRYQLARLPILSWEPASAPPPPPGKAAARPTGGGGAP